MKNAVSFSYLIAFILFSLNLFSQELTWKRYSVNDGLVQSQVNHIFQDSKGYLWVSTRLGVSRFDGINFVNFTEKDGLLNSWARHISQDADENIWMLFRDGFTRYDGHYLTNYIFPPNMLEHDFLTYFPLAADSIVIYHMLKTNTLIESFLIKGEFKTGKQIQLPKPLIERPEINAFKYDPTSGTLWIADKGGILYSFKDGTIKKYDLEQLQGFEPGPGGKLYYINHGSLYCLKNNHPELLLRNAFNDHDSNSRLDMAIDKTGNIVVYYAGSNQAKIIATKSFKVTEISFPITAHLCFDLEQNLWIGTENGLLRSNSLAIINFLPEKGGMHTNVWSITEGKTGEIYFSSYYDGLQKFKNGKFTLEKTLPTLPDGSKTNLAMGSIVDADHNIYLTTHYYPMIKFDGQTFTIAPKIKKSISSFIIRQNRNDGSLMIGGYSHYIKVNSDFTFDSIRVRPGNGKSNVVTGIEADKLNRIWLGGFNGMSMLLGDSLIHLPTVEFPFENGGNTLLRDHRDNLWIGNKTGLYFYNYQTFEKIGDALLNDLVVSLITVGDTTLFVGSIKKIYMLNLKDFYAKNAVETISVGEDKGFEGIEPGQNGFFKDSKGFLWLPCNDRCVRIDPGMISVNTEAPKVYITNLQILDKEMAWKTVKPEITRTKRFSMQADEKNLRFDFIGISLSHPQTVIYSFMLEGYDEDWSEPTHAQSAVYTNLPPGHYRFKVKAENADGVSSIKEAMVNFTILPALYQRRSFQIIIILIVALLFFATGAYFMHLKRKKQRRELENNYYLSELRLLGIQN